MSGYLRPLKKPKRIPKIISLDIEAPKARYLMAGVYDGVKYAEFLGESSLVPLVRFLLGKRFRGAAIFAHYGGGFDFRILLPAILETVDISHVQCLEKAGKLFCIKVRRDKHLTLFLDSYDLLPFSLKKLGDMYQTEHRKLDFSDFDSMKIDDESRQYLKNDVLCLYEVLQAHHNRPEVQDTGHAFTRAQQSMNIFRRGLKYHIETLSKEAESFVRNCLFGGRTEVFKKRGKSLNYYDVNSMYPAVMKDEKMPIGRAIRSDVWKPGEIGFYRVDIELKEIYAPPLPVKVKVGNDNKLLFPVGRLTNIFATSAELEAAQDSIVSLKIHDGYRFERSDFIFAEYVDFFYRVKQGSAKDSADYHLAKLAMNSLFGKFGQRRDRESIIYTKEAEKGLIPYVPEFGLFKRQEESTASYIIPSISAHITACARARLFQNLGDSTFYCDTDSVITTQTLPTSDRLGDWKLEKTISSAVFLAPKTYLLDTNGNVVTRHKGIPTRDLRGSIEIEKWQFDAAAEGYRVPVTWRGFDGFAEGLKRAARERTIGNEGAVLIREVTKSRTLPVEDTKRIWLGNDSRAYIGGIDIDT